MECPGNGLFRIHATTPIITILALIPVLVVAFDRIGIETNLTDPTTVGYASIGGTALAILLGLLVPLAVKYLADRGIIFRSPDYATPEVPISGDFITGDQMSTASGLRFGEGTSPGMGSYDTDTRPVGAQATLTVRSGSQSGQSFNLRGGVTTIGRSSESAVVLDNPTVSRHHARITQEGGGYFLEDVGSSSGTFLNGSQIRGRERLSSGSIIRIGNTEVNFEAPVAAGAGVTQVGTPQQSAGDTMVLGATRGAAWLLVQKGTQAGQSFVLHGDTNTIGRSSDCVVRLEDPAVSNSHALICKVDERYVLYDAGSSGGTRVNGQSMTGGILREGSRINLGSSELEFSVVEVGAPASPGVTMVLQQEKRGTLLVRSGPAAGQSFPIGDEMVIGREPGPGGAAINDPAISRRHALVRQTGEGYTIYDLGSANGTVVDGTRLLGRTLQNEDTIEVGATVLQFGQS
jgi:pSer/pThr/pTyr-binding forkhead associated (FHA) protein